MGWPILAIQICDTQLHFLGSKAGMCNMILNSYKVTHVQSSLFTCYLKQSNGHVKSS